MSTAESSIYIEAFDKNKIYKGLKKFSCGDRDIDKYARENFRTDGQRDNKMIWVLASDLPVKDDPEKVEHLLFGFVTLQNFSFNLTNEHRALLMGKDFFGHSMPRMVSTLKIHMIGVDKNYQKKPEHWGSQLLRAVLEKALAICDVSTDIKGVVLDAAPDAVDFYKRFRFVALHDAPDEDGTVPMLLPIHQLRDAMERAKK